MLKATVFCLIIASLAVEDWIKTNDWTGSLFFCTSGEYEGQQYFSIYCSSSDCEFKNLGKAGVIYLITSVLSLIINITWACFTIHQYKLGYGLGTFIKVILPLGSAGIYFLGILAWVSISGVFSLKSSEQEIGIGPKISVFCSIIYAFAVIFYFLVDINYDKELITNEDDNKDENTPNMKSVKIEGRFEYPSSLEHEGQGEGENFN